MSKLQSVKNKRKIKKAVKPASHKTRSFQQKETFPILEEPSDLMKEDQKIMRFELRLTNRQLEMIAAAAVILGFKNPTDYVRQYIHENSVRIIREQAILEIAEKDQKRFLEEIQKAAPIGTALKKAVKHYQKTVNN